MKQHQEELYEGMYIVSATLSDEARKKALDRIQSGITSRSGEVLKVHDQGKKRLAYQINGHKEGYYYLMYFQIHPGAIADLWQEYHLNEDLIRFMTTKADKVLETIAFKTLEEAS